MQTTFTLFLLLAPGLSQSPAIMQRGIETQADCIAAEVALHSWVEAHDGAVDAYCVPEQEG
jgi:hypothetical protein